MVLLVCVLYLFLRLNWRDTIEFGYDQPILASRVNEFLQRPSFIESYNYVNVNPWGYPSWGPVQIFFYAFFFLISNNPITVSVLVAIFNILSVVCVVIVGWKFFSLRVGLVAGLILSCHPWWIVFSRMVYEPTPVPTFVAVAMLFCFYVIRRPRSFVILPLIFLFGFLFQLYIHTISFVAISFVSILGVIKKTRKVYLFLGIIVIFILFLPTIHYYFNNQSNLLGFIGVAKKFQTGNLEKGHSTFDAIPEFFNTMSGSGFRWQLGSAYEIFLGKYIYVETLSRILIFISISIFIYHLIHLVCVKNDRGFRGILLGWAVAPIFFLIIIRTPIALPRYYLLSLPAYALLFGILIDDLFKKIGKFIIVLPIVLSIFWVIFIANYFEFIKTYSYPNGFLSSYSDPPYRFLESAFDWIKSDAKIKGYSDFVVSSDPAKPNELVLNTAQNYYWNYILRKNFTPRIGSVGYYLMYFSPVQSDTRLSYVQFGPYVVYEVKK